MQSFHSIISHLFSNNLPLSLCAAIHLLPPYLHPATSSLFIHLPSSSPYLLPSFYPRTFSLPVDTVSAWDEISPVGRTHGKTSEYAVKDIVSTISFFLSFFLCSPLVPFSCPYYFVSILSPTVLNTTFTLTVTITTHAKPQLLP